jgi:hypothetical protein
MWLAVAAAYLRPSVTLLFGLSCLVRHSRRREIVNALLALIWVANGSAVVVLVASLLFLSGSHVSGRQLLFRGGAALLTNAIAFGVTFWEPDCGGPVARALASTPRLWDYLCVSLTNGVAFSPTDPMPLMRSAKALMAAESTLSALIVLLIAARAVNILV